MFECAFSFSLYLQECGNEAGHLCQHWSRLISSSHCAWAVSLYFPDNNNININAETAWPNIKKVQHIYPHMQFLLHSTQHEVHLLNCSFLESALYASLCQISNSTLSLTFQDLRQKQKNISDQLGFKLFTNTSGLLIILGFLNIYIPNGLKRNPSSSTQTIWYCDNSLTFWTQISVVT